ncbi:MAG: hypothetical protein PW788_13920 [Micavibrio sp.]|nr:hypothetical protein [Micavibrio sp.]
MVKVARLRCRDIGGLRHWPASLVFSSDSCLVTESVFSKSVQRFAVDWASACYWRRLWQDLLSACRNCASISGVSIVAVHITRFYMAADIQVAQAPM